MHFIRLWTISVSSEVTGMLHDCVETYYGSLLTAQTHAATTPVL